MSRKLADVDPDERGIPLSDWLRTQDTVNSMRYRIMRINYLKREQEREAKQRAAHEAKIAGRKGPKRIIQGESNE